MGNVTPDARLWQAVLGAALHDAAQGKDAGWIGSGDFHMVCALAGLDPEAVQGRFNPETYVKASRAA